jgi:hypothetical protein
MGQIAEIKLAGGGSLFVETEDVEIPTGALRAVPARKLPEEGAEEVGAKEKVKDTIQQKEKTNQFFCC